MDRRISIQQPGATDAHLSRIGAVLALASSASAAEYGRPAAILVSPIHEAQSVRGDDGMDHVEYELLVVRVFPEMVILLSVTALDPAGKELCGSKGMALPPRPRPCSRRRQRLYSRLCRRLGRRRPDPAAGHGAGKGQPPDRVPRSRRTRSSP